MSERARHHYNRRRHHHHHHHQCERGSGWWPDALNNSSVKFFKLFSFNISFHFCERLVELDVIRASAMCGLTILSSLLSVPLTGVPALQISLDLDDTELTLHHWTNRQQQAEILNRKRLLAISKNKKYLILMIPQNQFHEW